MLAFDVTLFCLKCGLWPKLIFLHNAMLCLILLRTIDIYNSDIFQRKSISIYVYFAFWHIMYKNQKCFLCDVVSYSSLATSWGTQWFRHSWLCWGLLSLIYRKSVCDWSIYAMVLIEYFSAGTNHVTMLHQFSNSGWKLVKIIEYVEQKVQFWNAHSVTLLTS